MVAFELLSSQSAEEHRLYCKTLAGDTGTSHAVGGSVQQRIGSRSPGCLFAVSVQLQLAYELKHQPQAVATGIFGI